MTSILDIFQATLHRPTRETTLLREEIAALDELITLARSIATAETIIVGNRAVAAVSPTTVHALRAVMDRDYPEIQEAKKRLEVKS